MTTTTVDDYAPKMPTGRGKPGKGESLADLNKPLAAEWHPTKNKEVTASAVRPGGHQKAWWVCAKGHVWAATIGSRNTGVGCPGCAGKAVTDTNNLAYLHPEIAAEWHPTKNDRTASDVTAKSSQFATWRCAKGHEWRTKIQNRTNGKGCAQCSGRAPSEDHNLAAVNPQLAAEWHPTKNDKQASDFTPRSGETVWWKCANGHEWEARIAFRAVGGGCAKCKGKAVSSTNNLAVMNPAVAAEWHPTKNDCGPENVLPGSHVEYWWKCADGHEWRARTASRAQLGYGCSKCSGRSASDTNNLAILYPEIAAEWHPTRNDRYPENLTPGSGIKFWWRCSNGHEWEAVVNDRTSGSRCPSCSTASGTGIWTRKRLREFVEGLLPHIAAGVFSQAELLSMCQQRGVTRSTEVTKAVVSGTVADLEALIERLENPAPPVFDDDDGLSEDPELSGLDDLTGDENFDNASDDETEPGIRAENVLRASEVLLAASDEETAEFLVASQVGKLWSAAYADPKAVEAVTNEPSQDPYRETVRSAFRAQYDQATAVTPPSGWEFRPNGPLTKIAAPSLMQRHVANQVVRRWRYGNWSGTGAGKTVSAVLAARLLNAGTDAGIVLVVCPNNTVTAWGRVIRDCYPDNRVATKTMSPTWGPGNGPRWLVINVEALQQPKADEHIVELLARPDIRIDMVVLDEIHFFKHRGTGGRGPDHQSIRRENLKWILGEAANQKPDVAVLGLSATPVVNDLHEGRSILELVGGTSYNELPTRATIQNSIRMHQRFVLEGTRYLPKYKAELDEHNIEIGCDHLVEAVRELGHGAHPAEVEKVLIEAKMATIVKEARRAKRAGKRTLVYSEYVEGIFEPVAKALEAAGLRVGIFNGTDKTGLVAFTGVTETGAKVADADRVDVLIGSSAIGTGVDGLQHVTDTLIFATLPWTSAGYQQVVGRVHRQGQTSHKVRVVTPVTVAQSKKVGGAPWSWCKRRSAVISHKRTMADAVLDGTVPPKESLTPQKVTESILRWLHRIDSSVDTTVVTATQPLPVAA